MKQWRTLGPHSTSEGVMWVMTQSWRSTFWVVQSFRVHILHSRLVTSSNYRCPKLQKKSLGVKSKMSFNPEKFTYWTPKSWRFGMMSFPLKKGMIFSFQPFAPDVGCLSKLKLIWTNFAIFLKEGLFLIVFWFRFSFTENLWIALRVGFPFNIFCSGEAWYTLDNCHLEPKNHPMKKGKSSEPNLHDFGFKMLIFQGVLATRIIPVSK